MTGKQDKREPLFEGSEWTFDKLHRTYAAIEDVALNDLGLDVYANQIEIISSEQMLDAYSSIGPTLISETCLFVAPSIIVTVLDLKFVI